MYLSEVLLLARRRRYVVLPGLLLTAAGVAAIALLGPTQIRASQDVILIEPADPDPRAQAVQSTATVISRVLNSQPAREELNAQGLPGESYLVQPASDGTPILEVTVEAPEEEVAVTTMAAVIESLGTHLDEYQAAVRIPSEHRATSQPLSGTQEVDPLIGARARAIVIALGLGLMLTAGLALVLEMLPSPRSTRLRREKHSEPAHGSGGRHAHAATGPESEPQP